MINRIKNLSTIPVILTVTILLTSQTSVSSRCSINTLRNVCEICEERALSNLSTDSVCPACPEINCPTASLACIKLDSFEPFLKPNYTLSTNLPEGISDISFMLNISKNNQTKGAFQYDVRGQNFRTVIQENTGFIFYDLVNFNLPVQIGEELYSYNCIGSIDTTSAINGICSTIARNEEREPASYSFQFTALPSDSPLQ